ncbi:MAG: Flp pilus assembly protein CpaB [Symbiobacteriaceae bacterium]|jgi:pilus assembly protein CpaB|nr:Flp pilus assembly protein CpaB [Symbiobacteriaceae bacterium]
MQPSRLPLTLALVTFVLALLSGGYAYSRIIRTVPVLVAAQDIPAGSELRETMVEIIRVPAGAMPRQALYGLGQVAGQYAAVPLFASEMLTARHITSSPEANSGLVALAPEERVVSIPVRPEAVLGGALRPGDVVDVAAAWPGEGKPGNVQVLVSSVRVVDLRNSSGQPIQADGGETPGGAIPATALLAVTAEQGRALVGSVESKASLYLWLVGRDGR